VKKGAPAAFASPAALFKASLNARKERAAKDMLSVAARRDWAGEES
jgi:hypothetical protein